VWHVTEALLESGDDGRDVVPLADEELPEARRVETSKLSSEVVTSILRRLEDIVVCQRPECCDGVGRGQEDVVDINGDTCVVLCVVEDCVVAP
jgi:hypothetical protein